MAMLALRGVGLGPAPASRADVAVGSGGIGTKRIGESTKAHDAVALVIVLVKSVFLLKTELFLFSVGALDHKHGVEAKIGIGSKAVGSLTGGARKTGGENDTAQRAVGI